jgi:UDP-2,3-diacylglucosamine hydrolase
MSHIPVINGRGLVVSDLHLFSGRSAGLDCLESIRSRLAETSVLVLNGDTFDFRWSTLGDPRRTLSAAWEWLSGLAGEWPACRIHFIVGNHDCCRSFTSQLSEWSKRLPHFHWHEESLRLGSALFLHGDCAHREMDGAGLARYREAWQGDRPCGRWLTVGYRLMDRVGVTWGVHRWHFPRRRTVRRLTHYLDHTAAGWRQSVRHCYFGHTHLPFTDYSFQGITYHNTGSAIGGMPFNPLAFDVAADLHGKPVRV